jgi:hypothetical protein
MSSTLHKQPPPSSFSHHITLALMDFSSIPFLFTFQLSGGVYFVLKLRTTGPIHLQLRNLKLNVEMDSGGNVLS